MIDLNSISKELSILEKDELIAFINRIAINDTILDFALNYHVDAKGKKLRFNRYYHMVELYEYSMFHRDIVIMGGAQIGKSVWLLITALALAANGLNVFYVLPKSEMRDSYVQEKVQRPIAICADYQKFLKDAVSNKVQQIQFGLGLIRFVGANADGDFVSFPADALIYEETDKVKSPENLDLGMSRISDSIYKIKRFVSNPTGPKAFISLWFDKSDKRVYKCPCDKCGTFTELDWFKTVVKEIKDEDGNVVNRVLRDKTWEPNSPDDIKLKCPQEGCDGNIIRDHEGLPEDKKPYWEPTAISEQGIVGYHMPSLVSPAVSVRDLWYEYKEAVESPSKMEVFYSMRLALPYVEAGHKVSEGVLERCVQEGYKFELYPECAYWHYTSDVPTFMGVDVASEHFDVIISSREGDKERILYIGKHNPTNGVDFLHDLVNRYNVEYCAIDAVPETHTVKNFQKRAACEVWRMQYNNTNDAAEPTVDEEAGFIKINRTETLDRSYTKYKMRNIILPENYAEILEGTYLREMMALSRLQVETKNGFRNEWQGPAESDHMRHADNYRSALVDLLGETLIDNSCITIL